jgi:hypothetical protein
MAVLAPGNIDCSTGANLNAHGDLQNSFLNWSELKIIYG